MATMFRHTLPAVRHAGEEAPIALAHPQPAAATLVNRDLSLIEFFRRVLEEGMDRSQPILERLKFMAIFASNIDEFFMIRVSGLKEKLGHRFDVSPDGYTLPELLQEIKIRVSEMIETHSRVLRDEIIPELAENGIVLVRYNELTEKERKRVDRYFKMHVYPTLTPQAVDPTHPFPYISGGGLNLALFVRPKLNRRVARVMKGICDEFFVRIKIPSFLPRFVPVDGSEGRYVLIEEVVAANVRQFAPEADPDGCYLFRITRDADIDLREEEAADLLQAMEENLKQRRFGDVVRLEVGSGMPEKMLNYLTESLEISEDDVYSIDGPMNVTDAFAIVSMNRPDLKAAPLKITVPEMLRTDESKFDIIRRSDVLLHHPYMPYSIITDFIREAAEDPDVLAIKMCLYRIGANSPIAPLLIRASENGKQVTALIEIKARFDEANNIEWGKRLERAGVHVVYGILGLKTHAKTTLIVRREGEDLRRYVHLATGNYNPETSTVYTDLGLLTADEKIGEDATELFNYLTVYSQRDTFNKLLVAPICLREKMLELIGRETQNAENGMPARIIAKINRLADAEIVQALYDASRAGVEIDLIIRGICTLRPGVPGLSENIRVRSIVGRLLEHSRVYFFENGGRNEVYIGSSDWMPRNLDRRVEVLTPVQEPAIRRHLREDYLEAYLRDNVKAREMQPDGSHIRAEQSGEPFNAQLSFQEVSNVVAFGG
ncbi:MAG TPA: polyphosphate kinase 1 [Pyrinomonadaceae bacterium]|nr:polyphosphate kinase 1 [Pyrinomonadaceae bacterium]